MFNARNLQPKNKKNSFLHSCSGVKQSFQRSVDLKTQGFYLLIFIPCILLKYKRGVFKWKRESCRVPPPFHLRSGPAPECVKRGGKGPKRGICGILKPVRGLAKNTLYILCYLITKFIDLIWKKKL